MKDEHPLAKKIIEHERQERARILDVTFQKLVERNSELQADVERLEAENRFLQYMCQVLDVDKKQKKCGKCGKSKLRSEFYVHMTSADSRSSYCKKCTIKNTQKNRKRRKK